MVQCPGCCSPTPGQVTWAGALALRIYVIGNNGVGKSILLKDLAQRLSGQGLRTVGIAFGLTDRFDYKNAAEGSSTFLYDGARTTERSIALGRTSIDLIKLIRGIHLDPRRLATFDALVRHLGFGERRYLVPIDLSRDPDHARSRYAELKALSVNAAENAAVFDGEALSRITLGLMREDASESITTFPDLSSGEQQLLMLAVKITAHADSTTVLLVDEPEISMHVSWQRAIPRMLEIVSSRTRCSIVVATHSPVIIASATLDGDRCFVARDHRLTELELRQRRSVETALFDGFATHTANNRQVYERRAGLVSEAIRLMNAPAHQSSAERATQIDGFLAELERMRSTISGVSPMQTQMEHVDLDLDLVAKTRQAIEEIVRVGAGVDA